MTVLDRLRAWADELARSGQHHDGAGSVATWRVPPRSLRAQAECVHCHERRMTTTFRLWGVVGSRRLCMPCVASLQALGLAVDPDE